MSEGFDQHVFSLMSDSAWRNEATSSRTVATAIELLQKKEENPIRCSSSAEIHAL